jgi:hypothetical protein
VCCSLKKYFPDQVEAFCVFIVLLGMNLFVVGIFVGVAVATEIQVGLPAAGTRCFGEELQAHDLLVVKADTVRNTDIPADQQPVFNMVIKTSVKQGAGNNQASSSGSVVYKEEKQTSVSHAFTSTIPGPHWVCLTNLDTYKEMNVMLSMKSGVQAKDYGQIAKRDHLEPAQVAVKRMEDLLNQYKSNLFYQRKREESMRETVDNTADRALMFCVLNVALIVSVGLVQSYYFRRFFRSKKII